MNNDTPNRSESAAATSTRGASRLGSKALEEQLQALRQAYAVRLPEKVARLEELCKAIAPFEVGVARLPDVSSPQHDANFSEPQHNSGSQLDVGNNLATAHRLAHNLAGSGATYGLPHLSRAARALEHHLKALLEGEIELDEAACTHLHQLCSTLKETARAATTSASTTQAESSVAAPAVLPIEELKENLTGPASPWQDEVKRPLFLITDDLQLVLDIEQQIGYFGFAVRIFSTQPSIKALANALPLNELESAVIRMTPAVLIVDAALDGSGIGPPPQPPSIHPAPTQPTLVSRVQNVREELGAEPLPVIYIAEQGDMHSRLMAVRSGGAAYFTKPLDVTEFIDSLDTLTTQETPEPYRILIVDDDPQLLQFYAWALQGAGMQTQHVSDPLEIMEPLTNFRPDLILMDVYMPQCSGLELATTIRQQRDYVGIPIVFLSAETDVNKQLSAMSLGGDDFLTKPIQPDHLISAVTSRAQRSRSLRSFMMRDSLTGLLNHTTTKEQIDIEVSRARRQGDQFSVAMLDIDRFKSINDTHGHMTGDRVIKNLARLLQQRLRKTDVIGRYGGEEFAVLLAGANGAAALRVLNDIRTGFAALKQQAGGTEFSVTLSGGIATFPECDSAIALTDAADKALYAAKNGGRNKVVLSPTVLDAQ